MCWVVVWLVGWYGAGDGDYLNDGDMVYVKGGRVISREGGDGVVRGMVSSDSEE